MESTQVEKNVVALVPAAGSSTRMGLGRSKVLLSLRGLSALVRTVSVLAANPSISEIVVISRREDLEACREELQRFEAHAAIRIVEGGDSRQDSVRRGLDALGAASRERFVLVHDAARCLLSPQLVARCIAAARECGAVTAAIPQIDSLKQVDRSGVVERSIAREGVWAIQTPQVFREELLRMAHHGALSGATDDASLVERFHPVRVVEGERENLKVTTPFDLVVAEAVLAQRESVREKSASRERP